MANNPAENKGRCDYSSFTGRKKILLDYETVTRDNINQILEEALPIHEGNRSKINYLWKYYKGDQPVLTRIKTYREEINNKVLENRANEIVSFKDGYLLGEPIQYVAVGKSENLDGLNRLNDWMRSCDKAVVDHDLVNWMHICGTAYRIVNPSKNAFRDEDEAPFYTFCLDPRDTFVVYSSSIIGEPPILAVKYRATKDNDFIYSCYTSDTYYEVRGRKPLYKIVREEFNPLRDLPIIEYPLNSARLGSFELCLSLLDAINEVASSRVDGVDQIISSIMLFHNVDIDDDVVRKVKELGALAYADRNEQMKGEVKYITPELNQTQTQTLVSHMYETVLTICGMPNRNMNATSTSDTGASVVLRNGWSDAEARAKDEELMFKRSERKFLQNVLRISNEVNDSLGLKQSDIAIRFTRRNYENIATKANVLSTLLDKVPPRTAYIASGMFVDPEAEYEEYENWKATQSKETEQQPVQAQESVNAERLQA